MSIVSVVGARPQFIKAAVVSHAIKMLGIEEVMIHTGQHYDYLMSEVFFKTLDMPKPKYNLGVGGLSHAAMTAEMMVEIEKILLVERPKCVLVYGDTNSTLAGALVAAKMNIPVVHVEAGLRSYNRQMPEEINRVLTDHLSEILFAPTEVAVKNLEKESIVSSKVCLVGDVMFDAVRQFRPLALESVNAMEKYGLRPGYVLTTIHRAENTDSLPNLKAIFESLSEIAKTRDVILPLHPRTKNVLEKNAVSTGSIKIIDPVPYFEMLALQANASMVVTDSGGMQKESFFMAKPCLVLRTETEWVELVDAGWVKVCEPRSKDSVLEAFEHLLGKSGSSVSPYGDGYASEKIASIIQKKYFNGL